ncbi:glucose-6-phosphate dehydrogenase assembly protein OpcA [Oxynema sp. CENA135]|uniref:glucose-6-phosphate dehydrogenase assembly protein OpcA n=1 Tax=Oxynema sp. CENA135 TaxID=984206 RepID=UPI00190A22D2|nr:glucose-6-phosphate dehydrogenase assembly protein OpcA [Oxynema sp. CENA135]MBK4732465.1 glucose-6-phosphate dehydrogenase assembly protein OpcA [Oxynema sp. CENA135]
MNTPIVALQKPKDISLEDIESELSNIWLSENGGKAAPVATRATTFSMVVYEPEEFQQLLGALGFYDGPIDGIHGSQTKEAVEAAQQEYGLRLSGRVDPQTLKRLREAYVNHGGDRPEVKNADARGFSISDAIAAQNPCRIVTLCPVLGEDTGVTAQVSAYCPIQKQHGSNLICCEYITLRGTKEALERVSDLVVSLTIPNLPKFVWWKATPNPEQELFHKLSRCCNCMIVDSSYFSDPESEFIKMHQLIDEETYIADLNWHRLSSWQELTAAAFDPPERRTALVDLDGVTIDYEKGNAAQAFMFLGWMASRLGWEPKAYIEEGGDYDITRIKFDGPNHRTVEAELAAIPTADWGEIPGDLVGLRLSSTTNEENCCTILCSETTGCMRMEAGGTAQSSRTEQVTPLTDQKAEYLLSQQLQRWGRDALYEESLAVVVEMLSLRQN